MLKEKLLMIMALFGLFAMLQSVSATYIYTYDSPHFSYWYNSDFDGGGTEFYIGEKVYSYHPSYYGYGYTKPYYGRYDRYRDYPSGRAERQKVRAVNFVINSYNERYDVNAGKTSEEAFYYDYPREGENVKSSNFRNKPAYDLFSDGIDSKNNYYYKPLLDPETQTYNWRF